MENVWDRAARALRPVFFVACIVTIPVFMVSYLYMLRLFFDAQPTWLFALVGVSHLVSWIAFAMLHDFRREKQNLPPYYQRMRPADPLDVDQT